jgi:transcriptional regulator with XRE-family HTH domain
VLLEGERFRRGLNQREAGELLGFDGPSGQVTLSCWERGVRPILAEGERAEKLASFLSMTVRELEAALRRDRATRARWERRVAARSGRN